MWVPTLEALLPPGPREVHFWCLFPQKVCEPRLTKLYEGILSPKEKEHVFEANNGKLRLERLYTRALVRTLLARYTGGLVDPCTLKFKRSSFGKPEVIWPRHTIGGESWQPPSLQFNLSHTSSLIACGITSDSSIGIDVEETTRLLRKDVMAFAQRKFSQSEIAWLDQFSDITEQHQHFMQLWTLKEACVKALGQGIRGTVLRDLFFVLKPSTIAHTLLQKTTSLPTSEEVYSITLESSNPEIYEPSSCRFLLFQPSQQHISSICVTDTSLLQECNRGGGIDIRISQTIPFVEDRPLEGALGLGITI